MDIDSTICYRAPQVRDALAGGGLGAPRYNETCWRLYGRPPRIVGRGSSDEAIASGVSLSLPYRPPYDWTAMLSFLAARAIPGVERVAGGVYHRTIAFGGETGRIAVEHWPERSALRATIYFPRLSLIPTILMRLRRVFDLGADPALIGAVLGRDPLLAGLIAARPGMRAPGAWDGFEIAVRAMLGQQITVAGATRLAGKLVAALAEPLPSILADDGLTHPFPNPEQFQLEKIATVGMPRRRAAALSSLAAAAAADPRLFDRRSSLEEAVAQLCRLPGVGEWTAHYIAMRVLGESDAFPAADVALQRALARNGVRPSAKELTARAERWRPWRAYAALYLWSADSTGTALPEIKETHDATVA